MSDAKEKLKALQLTIDKLEKTYGKGTVMKLSDEKVMDIPFIPTGSLGLDLALGIGGIPRGRVTEIYGPESSGKTTLTMHCIAEAQKRGGLAAFIDAEHAFDRSYAERLGIDTENLLISQPDNGEKPAEASAPSLFDEDLTLDDPATQEVAGAASKEPSRGLAPDQVDALRTLAGHLLDLREMLKTDQTAEASRHLQNRGI